MSVQFGKWNFDGKPAPPEHIEKIAATLETYGPDGNGRHSKDGVTILYNAFHTTKESRLEIQPYTSPSGAVITWDGRLDNRKELIGQLGDSWSSNLTDVEIVAAAYERWDTACFGKLIGSWALSIWNPAKRSLLLAKDPIGTRHLFYCLDDEQVTWSTTLDPLVRFSGKTFGLDKEYIAGWMFAFPATHLTPFVGVHAVPASSWVLLRPRKHFVTKYWDFDPEKRVRYRRDAEYEDHFRTVFAQAVRRSLRSDLPVLAELSGGRDSSSIVCVADQLIAAGQAETSRLDTVSCYDDSEPYWDERPYFTKVEQQRGRTGWHINAGQQDQADQQEVHGPEPPGAPIIVHSPGADGRTSRELRKCLTSQGNRVLLSGIGGDEVMGGVPTPVPELQDLLARAQFRTLARQLKAWALQKRKPWFHLFWEAARGFLPPGLVGVPKDMRPASWLQSKFVKRNRAALRGYPSRIKLFGPLPTFQENVDNLEAMRRQLACAAMPFQPPFEKRYPFLDRDLLEFMFAIPREQLVRPTQRRSLMRRALAGIVPDEILNRKTKAFVSRAPLAAVSRDWAKLVEATQNMVTAALGIVDTQRLSDVLQKARRGEEVPMIVVMRTLYIDGWLKDLRALGIMDLDMPPKPRFALSASAKG